MLPRELPPKPAYVAPVPVARPADGTDWRIVALREQNARKEANSRLVRFGQWYDARRAEYAGQR